MELERLLALCRSYECRSAALYRRFAARSHAIPEARAMWTALAEDEEAHARMLDQVGRWLDATDGWRATLDGWEEALADVEERLADAEQRDVGTDLDRMLVVALTLERTELDALYRRLAHGDVSGHADRLLAVAARSRDPAVQFEAALLRGHNLLEHAARAAR